MSCLGSYQKKKRVFGEIEFDRKQAIYRYTIFFHIQRKRVYSTIVNLQRNRLNQFTKEDEAVDTSCGTEDYNKIWEDVMKRNSGNVYK